VVVVGVIIGFIMAIATVSDIALTRLAAASAATGPAANPRRTAECLRLPDAAELVAQRRPGLAAVAIIAVLVTAYAFALEGHLQWRQPLTEAQSAAGPIADPNGVPWQPWSAAALAKEKCYDGTPNRNYADRPCATNQSTDEIERPAGEPVGQCRTSWVGASG